MRAHSLIISVTPVQGWVDGLNTWEGVLPPSWTLESERKALVRVRERAGGRPEVRESFAGHVLELSGAGVLPAASPTACSEGDMETEGLSGNTPGCRRYVNYFALLQCFDLMS